MASADDGPESDGVSSPIAVVGLGGGIDSRGGEYCIQSNFTIFVMREMFLFEEHMNLDAVSYAEKGRCRGVRYEVLPWVLSKHSYSLESRPQLGKDRITLSSFIIQISPQDSL